MRDGSAASGPVVLEVLNSGGTVVRRYSSADAPTPLDPNTLVVNAIWQRPQEAVSAAAGMHRFVWDFRPQPTGGGRGGRGGGRGAAPPLPAGGYSVRLTVNGKTYTQPLSVKDDPRKRSM